MDIKNRVCVITGGSGATGSAVVQHLQSAGASTISIGTRGTPRCALIHRQDQHYTLTLDLGLKEEVTQAVELITEKLGPISIWINTVGGFHMGQRVEETTSDIWMEQWRLNFQTALNTAQAILPHFKSEGAGRLINFGSAAALDSLATAGPYIVSKAAVHALTRTIASELEGDITCNAILPGTIDTPANRLAMPDADFSKWVTPQQIAMSIESIISGNENGKLVVTGS
jgi:3-oxoacyl-[acyl-carrier protein] reductase